MPSRLHLVAVVLAGSLIVAPSRVRGAEVSGALEAESGFGIDSNPDRVLGAAGKADAFLAGILRGRLKLTGERFGMTAQLSEAGRLYFSATGATALGSRLEASGFHAVADRVSLGASLLASDLTERGHQLDQDLVDALGKITWSPWALRLSAGAGWNAFSPRAPSLKPFLASGPRTVVGASWSFAAGERLDLAWDFAAPTYPRWRDFAGTTRDDKAHTLSTELVHEGSFLAAAGYAYTRNRSNAVGGAYERHRVHARIAAYLGEDVTLAARAALQWSSYPEPLFLAQQILLSDGQQNLDSLEVRLTYPIAAQLDVALGVAVHRDEATLGPGQSPSFTRFVGSLGLAWRGAWTSIPGGP